MAVPRMACPRWTNSTSTAVLRSLGRRKFTSSGCNRGSSDAKSIAEAFLNKFSQGQTFVRKQLLDANQLRLFSLTLNRPHLWSSSSTSSNGTLEDGEPLSGTPIPPYYHLVYFTPAQLPGRLGLDGTDASFNPDAPFTRRMWAGGSCHWVGANPNLNTQALLKVGEMATETTKVLSCEPKVIGKTGEDMLVVRVEKEFRNGKDELCVRDRRNWVFRTALDPTRPATTVPKPAELSVSELDQAARGKIVQEYNRDEATLFRFSALTFNGHRIHYDKPWARDVEGHRNVVVHGPMNLMAMLDHWRDAKASSQDGIFYPEKIEYRATSPVYAGEAYRVMMDEDAPHQKVADVSVVSNDGTTCMKGTISDWS
ncbi:hypothetical protein RBB50_002659 [Rhinocladiella similis]